MSILIKGMEMPKSCDSCDLIQFDGEGLEAHCPLSPYYRWCGTPPDYRPEGCPLVEVPTPHGRLIDEEAIYNNVKSRCNNCHIRACAICGVTRILNDIRAAPTIIEAEVSE